MEIELSDQALSDLEYWKKSGQVKIQKKIKSLLESIKEDPFNGIGKPEPLKYTLTGFWSRRIDKGNRIIYEITDNIVYIDSLKGHYD